MHVWVRLIAAAALMLAVGTSAAAAWAQGDGGLEFDYTFDAGPDGWTAGFADLPVDWDQSIFELDHRYGPLPDGLDGNGVCLRGHNRSDDLFMFLKRQVGDLRPNAVYDVHASVDLATNVSAGLIGIGGSPGESVFVKVGASSIEPVTVEDRNRHLRMNIDKGNQARGGTDMAVVGNVAHSQVIDAEFRIKTLDSDGVALTARADEHGRLWLIVGTDSGFEGLTRLCYARISFTLSAEDGAATEPADSTPPTAPEPAATEPTEPPDSAPAAEPEPSEPSSSTPPTQPEPTGPTEPEPSEPDDTAPPGTPGSTASAGAGWPAWATAVIVIVAAILIGTVWSVAARRSRSH